MTEIDERIVAMHFDNKQFEKGARQTIETLEKLKESLDMDDAAEGLNTLGEAASKLDLADQTSNAEKFHKALEGIGKVAKTVLSPLASPIKALGSAFGGLMKQVKSWFGIDLAHDIQQSLKGAVKALTVEPVKMGWDEYEMKMDSIKTIMSGTAEEFAELSDEEHMGKVKETLEELNHYADDTIYSFKDMTSNIGKFTNAGVKLDVAARSMMGISNLAAKAGQGTQQASMAMYNFSQSMGLGYVELRDWRSIENANMATQEFKNTLIDVGLAMGTLEKDSKGVITTNVKGEKKVAVTAKNLRETLQKKWLTSDVLESTLEIYSGNLGEKELRAMGNFTDEQITAFLKIGAEAKEAATQVRTFGKMWDSLREAAQSGWAVSFEKIIGDMNEATEFWSDINKRISGWLETSAKDRNAVLNQWRGMSKDGSFRFSEIDGRQEMILALHNILDIVENIGGAIKEAISWVFGEITGNRLQAWSQDFRKFTDNMSAWLGNMSDGESRINKISRIIKGMLAPIKLLIKLIKPVVKVAAQVLETLVDPLINVATLFSDLVIAIVDGKFTEIPKIFESFGASMSSWFKNDKLLGSVGAFGRNLIDAVSSMFSTGDGESPIAAWFQEKFDQVGAVFNNIKTLIHWDEFTKWASGIWDKINEHFFGKPIAYNYVEGKNVYAKSGFGAILTTLANDLNEAVVNFKKMIHWGEDDSFLTWIMGEEKIDRLTGEKVRTKSGLSKTFDGITSAVDSFIQTVAGWKFVQDIGTFLTTYVYQPIVDFCTSKDGNASQLETAFNDIVTKVTGFYNTVTGWSGWTNVWDALKSWVIDPITKFYNWLVHGDENYSQNGGRKAHSPIGTIASGVVSDVALLKREQPTTGSTLDGIAEAMTEGFSKITGSTDVFNEKEGEESQFQKIMTWFSNLGTRISEAWNSLSSSVGTIATDITNFVTQVKDAIDTAIEFLTTENWEEDFNILTEKLGKFGETMLKLNGGLSSGKLLSGAGTFLGGAGKLLTAFSKGEGNIGFNFGLPTKGWNDFFTNLGTGGKDVFESIAASIKKDGVGKAIGQAIKGAKEGYNQADANSVKLVQSYANLLIEFAGSFALLGYALDQLVNTIERIESIEDPEKKQAIWDRFKGLLTNIAGAFAVTEIIGLASGIWGHQKVNSVGAALIGFAGGIQLMVLAVNTLIGTVSTTSEDKISKAVDLLAQLGIIIGAFDVVHQVSSIGDHNSKSGLIGFVIAIEGLILELSQLIEIIKDKDIQQEHIDRAYNLLFKLSEIVDIFVGVSNLSSFSVTLGESKLGSGSKKTGLIGFALAIEALLHAVKEIAELSKDGADLETAKDTIEQLGGVINKFEIFKNLSSFKIGSISVGGGKSGVIGFVVAMTSLVNSVIRLANNDPKKIEEAGKVIESLGEMLTKFVRTRNFGSLFSSGFNVAGFEYKGGKASGVLGFILAINELLLAAALIAGGDVDKMKQAETLIERVGNMITGFTAIYDVTSGIGSTGQRISAMLAMVAFAGALWLIMQQVTEFSKMDDTQFNNADRMMTRVQDLVKSLALALIGSDGMVAAIAMVKNVDAKTMALGALKVLEGLAIVFVGGGLLGWLIGFLNDDFLAQLDQGVKVAGKVGNLLGEFFHGIVAPFLSNDETEDIKAMNTKLADIDEGEMDHAIMIMGKIRDFGDSLKGFNPTLFQQWFNGDITLGQFAQYMTELAGGLNELGKPLSDSATIENAQLAVGMLESIALLASSVKTAGDDGLYGLTNLLDTIAFSVVFTNDGPVNRITALSEAFSKLGVSIAQGVEQGAAGITADSIIDKIVQAIESGSTRISDAVASAIRAGISGVDLSSGGPKTAGNPITQPLIDGAEKSATELKSRAGEVVNLADDSLGAAGTQMGDLLIEGMLRVMNGEDAQTVLNDLGSKAGTVMTETASDFGAKAGETMGFNFSQEVGKSSEDTYKAATQVPTAAANAIKDHTDKPVRAIRNMGSSMLLAFNETLSINSPSKEFYDSTQFAVQGIALSLVEHQPVLDAIYALGADMLYAWQIALAPIDALIQSDPAFHPQVSPVLDMSATRSGMNALATSRLSLGAVVPSFSRNFQAPAVDENRQNGSQIVASINDRIDQLNTTIANLKLYLDTGALVGGTVAAYDRALGFRAARAARG